MIVWVINVTFKILPKFPTQNALKKIQVWRLRNTKYNMQFERSYSSRRRVLLAVRQFSGQWKSGASAGWSPVSSVAGRSQGIYFRILRGCWKLYTFQNK